MISFWKKPASLYSKIDDWVGWKKSEKLLASMHVYSEAKSKGLSNGTLKQVSYLRAYIVSVEIILFWNWKMWKFSYSLRIMAICYFMNWIDAAETIEGRKLFVKILYVSSYRIKEIDYSNLGSFHKLRMHLGVGRWSEKCVVY